MFCFSCWLFSQAFMHAKHVFYHQAIHSCCKATWGGPWWVRARGLMVHRRQIHRAGRAQVRSYWEKDKGEVRGEEKYREEEEDRERETKRGRDLLPLQKKWGRSRSRQIFSLKGTIAPVYSQGVTCLQEWYIVPGPQGVGPRYAWMLTIAPSWDICYVSSWNNI